jgi:tetratricopeptide (TPR) repeat protein
MMDEKNDNVTEKTTEAFKTVKRLMAKGNFKQAKKEFDMLPAYIKNTRVADVLNIQISSELDEETYMAEIEKFEKKYTDEPGVQLTVIDLYFLRKDYDKALAAINAVDSLINKDPFLDYYRGLLYNVKGDSGKAIEYFTKVTESNPGFAGAFAELMAHYIDKNDKEKAKLYFTKYKGMRSAKQDVINYYEGAYDFLND